VLCRWLQVSHAFLHGLQLYVDVNVAKKTCPLNAARQVFLGIGLRQAGLIKPNGSGAEWLRRGM